jgi:hypothetical protein
MFSILPDLRIKGFKEKQSSAIDEKFILQMHRRHTTEIYLNKRLLSQVLAFEALSYPSIFFTLN